MSIQDQFLFEDEYDESDWKEDILQSRSDIISRDRSSAKIGVITDYSKYKAAVRFILGYSWVDPNLKYLHREVPVFHPIWPWLWARAITDIQFFKPTGKDTGVWEHSVSHATYTYARIEVEFGETRYDVLRDDEATLYSASLGYKEWLRYVEEIPRPYVENIQIDGGQLKAYAPSVAAINGAPFIGAPYVLARQEKQAFDLVWHEVPKEFLYVTDSSSTSYGLAPKLAAAQKKVNSVAFLGREIGTLLLEEIEAVPSPAPIATDVWDSLQFTYTVTMKFKYFNPQRGDTAVSKYGWNLLPGVISTGATAERTFGYYYYTHNGAVDGYPLFASYDFRSLFTHHSL